MSPVVVVAVDCCWIVRRHRCVDHHRLSWGYYYCSCCLAMTFCSFLWYDSVHVIVMVSMMCSVHCALCTCSHLIYLDRVDEFMSVTQLVSHAKCQIQERKRKILRLSWAFHIGINIIFSAVQPRHHQFCCFPSSSSCHCCTTLTKRLLANRV